MKNKVVLILVDGMRPDGIQQADTPNIDNLIKNSSFTLKGKTIVPSITLPCHASLFLSVPSDRHGITTNTWIPLVRPIDSIFDTVSKFEGKTASFYNWEELRDLSRPGNLNKSYFIKNTELEGDNLLTDAAIEYITNEQPDFIFLYLGHTDIAGHDYGWMSAPYIDAISNADKCIGKVVNAIESNDNYHLIITADHGGHERSHGSTLKEDMTIPLIFYGNSFEQNNELPDVSILDIAPTITDILEINKPKDWEGSSVVK